MGEVVVDELEVAGQMIGDFPHDAIHQAFLIIGRNGVGQNGVIDKGAIGQEPGLVDEQMGIPLNGALVSPLSLFIVGEKDELSDLGNGVGSGMFAAVEGFAFKIIDTGYRNFGLDHDVSGAIGSGFAEIGGGEVDAQDFGADGCGNVDGAGIVTDEKVAFFQQGGRSLISVFPARLIMG